MSKTGSANGSFFGNFIYDQLLRRRPHFLFDLSRAVDFSFVKATLKDFYADWGRDPWDPVLMFKMVFLQFLYDLSDRDVEEQCTWNLLFKSFLGLSAEELPPDHSVLCRFRQRLGAEGFQRLFNQVVEQARTQGLVSDRLHIVDATRMTSRWVGRKYREPIKGKKRIFSLKMVQKSWHLQKYIHLPPPG